MPRRDLADEAMLEIHHYMKVDEFIAHGSFAAVRGGAARAWMTPMELETYKLQMKEDEELDDYLDQ